MLHSLDFRDSDGKCIMNLPQATSQSSHLYLLLAVLKEWKSSPGSNLGSAPMALERNLSELQLQAAVEATGDLEVDCYRAPCCESQEELALQVDSQYLFS